MFNYSDIVISLTCLIQKDIPWKFDSSCQNTFNFLKKAFTSVSILTYWIPDAQLIVKTDASDYTLAAILLIVNEDNEDYLVAFHSHTFIVAELNYNTHNKELLAIFEAFKIWRHYLKVWLIPSTVKFTNGRLSFSISLFIFIFILFYFFIFLFFRTTRVRVDWSHCHISHNLIA